MGEAQELANAAIKATDPIALSDPHTSLSQGLHTSTAQTINLLGPVLSTYPRMDKDLRITSSPFAGGQATVPWAYFLCEDDHFLPSAAQHGVLERLSQSQKVQTIYNFGGGHCWMLYNPSAAVEQIDQFAQTLIK